MERAKIIRLLILVLISSAGAFLWNHEWSANYKSGITILMVALTGLWLWSLAIKNASIIDIFWGLGFVIEAWYYAYDISEFELNFKQFVYLTMISVWGLRLAGYLAYRNIGKPEDFRYAKWREENGKKWWWLSFFRVFAMQGFLLWIISAVFLAGLQGDANLSTYSYIGIVVWSVGFFFETAGDWQLMKFKKNPDNTGKVMNKGLWRYTRHPNYFGDAMIWWGFFIFALSTAGSLAFIFCPVFMTLLLLKVSGVAMLERTLKKTKPQYQEYIEKTSAFIPWPPKG